MEFPFGYHHHHRHNRPEDDPNPNSYPPPAHNPYGYQPPPPPPQPFYGGGPGEYPPPPPTVQHVSHESGLPEFAPPPPLPVQHVSHEVEYGGGYGGEGFENVEHHHHQYRPGFSSPPPSVQHVSHEYGRPDYAPPPQPPVQHVRHEVEYGGEGFENVEHHHHQYRPGFSSPPPSVQHVSHEYGRPEYAPPPPPPVQHVSHEIEYGGGYGGGGFENVEHHHHQHRPGFSPSPASHVEHVSHDNRLGELLLQPTVRIYTKAAENYSLSIRQGKVVLVPSNPRDEHQHWIKDLKYSTRVKDEEGLPSFALVNKVTGQAIKHAIGATHHVRLVPYKPDYLDESVLWTESKDTGEGFRCIRMVNNIRLNFDAFHGDEDHGGVRDGTIIVLWEWVKGKNQRWKIVPYCKFFHILLIS